MLKKRTSNMSDDAKMLTMKIPPCSTEKHLKIQPIYYSLTKWTFLWLMLIFRLAYTDLFQINSKSIKKEKCCGKPSLSEFENWYFTLKLVSSTQKNQKMRVWHFPYDYLVISDLSTLEWNSFPQTHKSHSLGLWSASF